MLCDHCTSHFQSHEATGEAREEGQVAPFMLSLLKEVEVLRDVRLIFVGHLVFGENRVHRALRLTGSAVDALIRINIELVRPFEPGLILARVDTVDRANVHTGGVLDVDARFRDYIRHPTFSS
jgi:hypothetical protein